MELKWVFQAQSLQKLDVTPLVVDGIMYITQPPNDVIAMDAKTGRVFWIYQYRDAATANCPCRGLIHRGLAGTGRHALHGHDRHAFGRD